MKPRIVITLEGGLITAASADVDTEVLVLDRDVKDTDDPVYNIDGGDCVPSIVKPRILPDVVDTIFSEVHRNWAKEDEQSLVHELQNKEFNVVTCGECGRVMLHRTHAEELRCPQCGFHSDICDFPDLFIQDGK